MDLKKKKIQYSVVKGRSYWSKRKGKYSSRLQNQRRTDANNYQIISLTGEPILERQVILLYPCSTETHVQLYSHFVRLKEESLMWS